MLSEVENELGLPVVSGPSDLDAGRAVTFDLNVACSDMAVVNVGVLEGSLPIGATPAIRTAFSNVDAKINKEGRD
jgi:hypothetical protein